MSKLIVTRTKSTLVNTPPTPNPYNQSTHHVYETIEIGKANTYKAGWDLATQDSIANKIPSSAAWDDIISYSYDVRKPE